MTTVKRDGILLEAFGRAIIKVTIVDPPNALTRAVELDDFVALLGPVFKHWQKEYAKLADKIAEEIKRGAQSQEQVLRERYYREISNLCASIAAHLKTLYTYLQRGETGYIQEHQK